MRDFTIDDTDEQVAVNQIASSVVIGSRLVSWPSQPVRLCLGDQAAVGSRLGGNLSCSVS